MYSRKLLVIVTVLFLGFCFGQNTKKELDSLFVNNVSRLFNDGKLKESLALCEKLIEGYEKIDEKKEVVKVYVFAANINTNLFEIKESLKYLDIALIKNSDLNNPAIEARIYAELGRNYKILGFRDKAIENYNQGLSIAKTLPVQNVKSILKYIYSARGVIYEEENNIKAFEGDLYRAHKLAPDVYTSARLAKFFISYKKNLDSAKYYLDFGKKLYRKNITPLFQYSVLQRNYGRYFFELQDYTKAIALYEESLSISRKLNKPQDIKDTHKLLFDAYKAMQNEKKAVENIEIYTRINDSLVNETRRVQGIPVERFIKEKEVHTEKSKNRFYVIIGAIIALFLAVYIFTRKKYNSRRKESDNLINIKEEENQQLQQKVNESFDDIIQLAKNNSPEFFTRFQEVYPEVISELLKINSKLRVSELTLCAFIYLGFNTKDIAAFTFRTISTVRNRKHNLRTKLNIPIEESTELWFKNISNKLY
ncbi:tetratricopeptide repeat protein [Chryseobacterium shigense]|uniref:Tetratricopeptide (TPR) repeat protein n=1 Tax=Chryseobacterium shigense TaxID=297244 RepID=A0A841MYP1_9FLAO|nr:tetratricopeptide repeat protein [Chryseobacterium shigense]MBB6369664.1 tetratricopeptide (TPR) repeat protein [Chryseobacterium shigense]